MNTAPHPPPNHRWRPGDLFVHPATADQDVEWLILPAGPETADLLVVAVDSEPLAGVGDLALPHDSPLAPLVIRCRATCRLDRSVLEAAVPTGHLEEPWPHEALELSENLEHGIVRGTLLERESEDDSELRHRRQVLADARRRLAEAGGEPASGVVAGPWKLPAPTVRSSPSKTLWQAAAGILLATCFGLAWLSVDLARDPGTAAAMPRVFPLEDFTNGGSVRSQRSSVTAFAGAWHLRLLVYPNQAPDGLVVEILEPRGASTEPLRISVPFPYLPQVIVEIPEVSASPGLHRVRLIDRDSGEILDEFDLILRPSPSSP